jgi:methylenetetrahydrofolate--tRNA-(uracil-5-)-methyltransferase
LPDRASGLLKNELRLMGSLLIEVAEQVAVPAGGALAVDREGFASQVTARLAAHPNIEIVRAEMAEIPEGLCIIASGPLTSSNLSSAIAELSGEQHLFFFDAISPIVGIDSVDMGIAFRASRYGRGDEEGGDYVNCPLNRDEYYAFVDALIAAERIELREFEDELKNGVRTGAHRFFEGCLPVEIIAERGRDSLAFGPMRPIGLDDPRTGRRPYAAVQLRQDNLAGTLYNLVGFQTNLKFGEQKRVFRMLPGLERAHFERYGQMHRNTFIHSPKLLRPSLQWRERDELLFAGQITGVEGYAGNIATGLLAGVNAARLHAGLQALQLPPTSMLGALCQYVTGADETDFQPMKANFGILPSLDDSGKRIGRRERAAAYAARAMADLGKYWIEHAGLVSQLKPAHVER